MTIFQDEETRFSTLVLYAEDLFNLVCSEVSS